MFEISKAQVSSLYMSIRMSKIGLTKPQQNIDLSQNTSPNFCQTGTSLDKLRLGRST